MRRLQFKIEVETELNDGDALITCIHRFPDDVLPVVGYVKEVAAHCQINGIAFRYVDSLHNMTRYNERRIEVPMGKWALDVLSSQGKTIELGDTLYQYVGGDHIVVDLYEKPRPNLLNIDFLDFDCRGLNLVSISTVEHIGWGEFGRDGNPGLFLVAMAKIHRECPKFFLTMPIGFREDVDNYLNAYQGKKILLRWKRDDSWNPVGWNEFGLGRSKDCPYDDVVITNMPEFWEFPTIS